MADNAVGQPLSRIDGPLKVTGRAMYAADHDLPGLVHAVLVSSTVSRSAISTLDIDKARSAPGVLKVLTNWNNVKLAYSTTQVNYFGQPVAIVVATTLEQAQHGASLVEMKDAAR